MTEADDQNEEDFTRLCVEWGDWVVRKRYKVNQFLCKKLNLALYTVQFGGKCVDLYDILYL